MLRFIFLLSLLLGYTTSNVKAQEYTVEAALEKLNISPDAQASGMGDVGAATQPGINSQHWNAAKYAFMEKSGGVGVSYVPWLRKITNDVNLIYLAGYAKFKNEQALSASVYFFSVGSISLYDQTSGYLNDVKPRDYSIDVAYSRKFGNKYSGALTFRYINSTIVETSANVPYTNHSNSLAADIGIYRTSPISIWTEKESSLSFGLCISNIGTKIKFGDNNEYFLPMNMRLGGQLSTKLDAQHSLSLATDFNKLLVPESSKYARESIPSAMAKSLSDGSSSYSLNAGLEYCYDNTLSLRTGYYGDSKRMGNRQYFTLGAGISYAQLTFDVSYLVLLSNKDGGALANTLRFTLQASFGNANQSK